MSNLTPELVKSILGECKEVLRAKGLEPKDEPFDFMAIMFSEGHNALEVSQTLGASSQEVVAFCKAYVKARVLISKGVSAKEIANEVIEAYFASMHSDAEEEATHDKLA